MSLQPKIWWLIVFLVIVTAITWIATSDGIAIDWTILHCQTCHL
jgi:hypothetical protein